MQAIQLLLAFMFADNEDDSCQCAICKGEVPALLEENVEVFTDPLKPPIMQYELFAQ